MTSELRRRSKARTFTSSASGEGAYLYCPTGLRLRWDERSARRSRQANGDAIALDGELGLADGQGVPHAVLPGLGPERTPARNVTIHPIAVRVNRR